MVEKQGVSSEDSIKPPESTEVVVALDTFDYIYPLSSMIKEIEKNIKEDNPNFGQRAVKRSFNKAYNEIVVSSFLCEKNKDILKFLTEKAVGHERLHLTRTFFYILKEKIIGFTTIALRDLDISQLKIEEKEALVAKIKNPSDIDHIPVYLIAQVAKNDNFNDFKFSGSDMLDHVINEIQVARESVGGKIVILDSVNSSKVMNFYQSYGFIKFGEPFQTNQGEILNPMFLNIENNDS